MEICCLCKQREAGFDGDFCSFCAHDMWEYTDEIRDIIGEAAKFNASDDWFPNQLSLSQAVDNLMNKMRGV
jgi:hypothetical protein